MESIVLLQDYKSSFASKVDAKPPYSGLDLEIFIDEMEKVGYKIVRKHFFEINIKKPQLYKGVKVIYQSSEANDGYGEYKSHIDDVLYFLKTAGAVLVPKYTYFKAHSNKVFMEMLRGFMDDRNKPDTKFYGSFEDFVIEDHKFSFPVVIKKAHGAQAKGVFKAKNAKELKEVVRKVSSSSYTVREKVKEKIRQLLHRNYIPFSVNRNKFIIQSFIENLAGDYKVLIFGDFVYLVKRKNRVNDFRASGGGLNSFTGEFDIPEGLLEYSYNIFKEFNCPFISLDIGVNEKGFHLIEYQFIRFGTSAHSKSNFVFKRKENGSFEREKNDFLIEYLYSSALVNFFTKSQI